MKRSHYQPGPSVVVLESAGKWETALQQACPKIRVNPVAQLESLAAAVEGEMGLLAIIEIVHQRPAMMERLKFVGFHASHPFQPCFVGVLDDRLSGLKKEISQFGFSEVLNDLYQVNRLVTLIHRHRKSINRPVPRIEQQVQDGLPWAPVEP